LWRIRYSPVETGVPIDDPAFSSELDDLNRMSLQLSLVFRELKSKSNLLSVQEQNLWNISPKDRYSAAASVRSKQADVNDVLKLAREIQELLEDLFRRSGLISEGELSKGIGEFIEQLYHQAHAHGEAQNMPDGLSYRSPSSGEFGGTIEGVTIFAFVALRAFVYWAKRNGKNQST